MAQQVGLQVFNENGEVYLDLTSRPTLYLGEVDIYPTVTTGQCSGEFGQRLNQDDYGSYGFFYVIERVYLSSIDVFNQSYNFPAFSINSDGITHEVYFTWSYKNSNHPNVPVRIRYGVF